MGAKFKFDGDKLTEKNRSTMITLTLRCYEFCTLTF